MPRKTPKSLRSVKTYPKTIQQQTEAALDPTRAGGKPRLWKDMTDEERAALAQKYRRRAS